MPPSSAVPTLPRRAFVALALVGGLTLFPAVDAPAQVPTTTAPGVLVPGDTTVTTVAPTTTTTTEAPSSADSGGLLDFDANEKVWIIVGALVALALLVLVLTVVYWRHTRPDRQPADRRIERAERKEQKHRRKATGKDPFADDGDDAPADDESGSDDEGDGDAPAGTPSGPLDLDELLSAPDPSRSVFGGPDEPGESPR